MRCDLLDAERVAQTVRELTPDVIIHAQALSDVDRCEREPDAARAQNVQTITNVVRGVTASKTLVIYVSTDYVFDGTKGAPYEETDAPHPINLYGRSKLEGERVTSQHPRGVVVRTSTLFGQGRMNFCNHSVQRFNAHQPVEAFIDQVTSPTYTEDLADGIAALSEVLFGSPHLRGAQIYHIANAGGCSRVTLANRIAELLGAPRELVQPIAMASQRRPAQRPAYSALSTAYVSHIIGRSLRPWDDALQAYLRQRHWLN